MRQVFWCSWVVCCGAGLSTAWAEDFRVETEVRLQQDEEPAQRTLTVFQGTTVYDFLLAEQGDVTVFDTLRDRVLLVSPARQMRAETTSAELHRFCEAIRRRALEREEEGFFAEREINYSWREGESFPHVCATSRVQYRARGIAAPSAELAEQYRRFADVIRMLNSVRPGQMPPFVRLRLNREIALRGELPLEVERTLINSGLRRDDTATAFHRVMWRLSAEDDRRIDQVRVWLGQFDQVGLSEYLGVTESEAISTSSGVPAVVNVGGGREATGNPDSSVIRQ